MSPRYSHHDKRFARYHFDIWVPARVRKALQESLPPPGTLLRLDQHYFRNPERRSTPDFVRMPSRFEFVDVTEYRQERVLARACLRFHFDRRRDLCIVLEFPNALTKVPRVTLVTAWWNSRDDRHQTLDKNAYEQRPVGKHRETLVHDSGLN